MNDTSGLTGISGYLNSSAGEGCPGIVVIHEMWGLNQQIRGVVDRLAKEGFLAFGVDLYRGQVANSPHQAHELVRAGDKAQWFADLRSAATALLPRKVGVVGFSMGGAFALATAAMVPEVSACVSFYGVPRPDVDLTKVRARVLGHYVPVDEYVPRERLAEVEADLRRAQISVTFHSYDARHSFFNEQLSGVYSPADARLAWERTVAFLKETLS
jgi:carboxymethylenebutenolidase